MKSRVIYIVVFALLRTLYMYEQRAVKDCPKDIRSWSEKSDAMECPVGLDYHCILTFNDILYEVCMESKIYVTGRQGCPWINFHNGVSFFGDQNTNCPDDLTGCPPKGHHGYTSDQLYQYPMCFVPEKERTIERRSSPSSYESSSQPTKGNGFELFGVIFLLAVIVLSAFFVNACLIAALQSKKT